MSITIILKNECLDKVLMKGITSVIPLNDDYIIDSTKMITPRTANNTVSLEITLVPKAEHGTTKHVSVDSDVEEVEENEEQLDNSTTNTEPKKLVSGDFQQPVKSPLFSKFQKPTQE